MSLALFVCLITLGSVSATLNLQNQYLGNWQTVLSTPFALRHGIQGPGVSPLGTISVGSVMGQYIAQVEFFTGASTTLLSQPLGEADDQVYGKDGTLVWTSLLSGLVRSRTPDLKVRVIGQNGPFTPNGVAFDNNGNCYYSQFPAGTGLYKVDPTGKAPQQFILDVIAPMNGFDFGSDNQIYGPLPFTGQIVRINVATKTQTVIASGFVDVESVRWSLDKKTLYALDIGTSSIYSVNPTTGAKTLICTVSGLNYLDNFRVYGTDGFLISDTVSNTLIYYKMSTKTFRNVTPRSVFGLPMGISFLGDNLYVADYVSEKSVNVNNNQVRTIARSGNQPPSAGPSAQDVSYGIWNILATQRYLVLSCFFDGRIQIRSTADNSVVVPTITALNVYGLAMSNNYQYLVAASYGTGVQVFTAPSYNVAKTVNTPFVNVTGLAHARDANTVYVADYTKGAIYKLNYITGQYSTIATGISKPEGLAVYNGRYSDTIFVAATGTKSVVQINVAFNYKFTVASNLPIGLPGAFSLADPNTFTGVAVHSSGDVYITSDINDSLIKLKCTYAN